MSDFGSRPPTAVTPNTTLEAGWYAEAIAAGTTLSSLAGELDAQGIWRLNTGTSSTSGVTIRYGSTNWISPGNGEIRVLARWRLPVLGTPSERTDTRLGLRNIASTRLMQMNIGDNLGSNVFRFGVNNGSGTTINSGITIVANEWHLFEMIINKDASQAIAKHNNHPHIIISSNIPKGASDAMTPYISHSKSVGSTSRTFDVDFMHVGQVYTKPLW